MWVLVWIGMYHNCIVLVSLGEIFFGGADWDNGRGWLVGSPYEERLGGVRAGQ